MTISQDGTEAQEWIPLANGCICCSVKDSGVAALESLVERQKNFDYILLETTGVADPGNIAPMFWMDEGLGSSIYLDGIVTVVDAKNILKSLDEPAPEELPESETSTTHSRHNHTGPLLTTAHLQISHADVILLNKTDLVSSAQLDLVRSRVSSINGLATLVPTSRSHVPNLSGTVLDLHAYSSFPAPTAISTPTSAPSFASKGHSHLDPTMSTLTIPLPPLDPPQISLLESWLQRILWDDSDENGADERRYEVHRTKGLVLGTDGTARVVQGVREVFDIVEVEAKAPADGDGEKEGKIVLIGRYLHFIPKPRFATE